MKFSTTVAAASLAMFASFAANAAVLAPVFTLTDALGNPITNINANVGANVVIYGTVFNPDPSTTEYIDSDSPVVDSPNVTNDDFFYNYYVPNGPLVVAPGDTSPVIDWFSFTAQVPDPILGHGLVIQGSESVEDVNDGYPVSNTADFTVTLTQVPEPGAIALLGSSLMGSGLFLRRRRRA
jgi:hypothetical protein